MGPWEGIGIFFKDVIFFFYYYLDDCLLYVVDIFLIRGFYYVILVFIFLNLFRYYSDQILIS